MHFKYFFSFFSHIYLLDKFYKIIMCYIKKVRESVAFIKSIYCVEDKMEKYWAGESQYHKLID